MMISCLFGLLAISALIFKTLQGFALFGNACLSCQSTNLPITFIGIGYFCALLLIMFRFQPNRFVKFGAMIWAIGLAIGLMYINKKFCPLCLIGHICHINMWLFWRSKFSKLKLSSSLGLIILGAALVYHNIALTSSSVNTDSFSLITTENKQVSLKDKDLLILHFVSANCIYCKEEIIRLNKQDKNVHRQNIRFINVLDSNVSNFYSLGSNLEWAEDKQGELRALFNITNYPTQVTIDSRGRIVERKVGINRI